MATSPRTLLALTLLLAAVPANAQQPLSIDTPAKFVPLRKPSAADRNRREARELFGVGLMRQRQDRLVEALRLLEEARQLDPEAAPPHKALTPLYLALGRTEDALTSCRKALDAEPADHESWYLYARQLRDLGRPREALDALTTGVECPSAKERLDVLVQMHFDRGTLSDEAGKLDQAEAAFREVIKILVDRRETLLESSPFQAETLDLEAAKTWERIGQVCIKAKRLAAAVDAFVAARKLDPDHAGRINMNLAEVCLAQDHPADALPYLDEYLKTQPQGPQGYEMKIGILKRLNRERDVLPMLCAYAERDVHNVSLQLLVARQFGRERQWREAERRFEKLAEGTPTPEIYRGLFDVYKEQAKEFVPGGGRPIARALDLLDQALAAATPKDDGGPGDEAAAAKARAMLVVLRDDKEFALTLVQEAVANVRDNRQRAVATWRLLGALAARAKQLDAAEEIYRACLTRVGRAGEAEIQGGLLDVLSEARKYEDVVKLCKEVLKKAESGRALFQVKLASALVHLGKSDEALAAADEAVKLADDRNRLALRRLRVSVLTQIERFAVAEKECRELLDQYKEAGEVRDIRYALSGVYSTAKEHAKAEEQLKAILADDPNDATANNDLGYILADQGKDLEEAERMIRKAIDLDREERKAPAGAHPEGDGDNAAFLDSLGWVLFRRGHLEEAAEWLRKASALPGGSDDPVVWDHLGDVYLATKDAARARAAWETAVRLYEAEHRRKPDDRYKDVKHKLRTTN